MHVIVTARHCELSDEVREDIQRRFDALEKFEARASRAEITVTGEKKGFEVEALVSVDRADRVHAHARALEMRSALDRVLHKLEVQLRRLHDRSRTHRAPPLDEIVAAAGEAQSGAEPIGAEGDEE